MTAEGRFISHSPEETFEYAYAIGERIEGGAVFLLHGDLGAGKTVFAKGIAAGLGIDPADASSPTFTLVNEHRGRLPFYHIDLYRLEGAGLGFDLGLDEIFTRPEAVIVVEWADRLGGFPVGQARLVRFHIAGDSERELELIELSS